MTGFEEKLGAGLKEAELRGLVVGKVSLGEVKVIGADYEKARVDLLMVNDGQSLIYMPSFDLPIEVGLTEYSLDELQKSRLQATVDLNLPPLVAVHLALNMEDEIGEYQPSDDVSYLIGIYGKPGALKSKLVAMMEKVDSNSEGVSLDCFAIRGLVEYRGALKHMKIEQGLEALAEAIEKVEPGEPPQPLCLGEALTNFTRKLKDRNRKNIYWVDLPGLDMERPVDAYDILASSVLTTWIVQEGKNKKETLRDYLYSLWQEGGLMLLEATTTERLKTEVFQSAVMGLRTRESFVRENG